MLRVRDRISLLLRIVLVRSWIRIVRLGLIRSIMQCWSCKMAMRGIEKFRKGGEEMCLCLCVYFKYEFQIRYCTRLCNSVKVYCTFKDSLRPVIFSFRRLPSWSGPMGISHTHNRTRRTPLNYRLIIILKDVNRVTTVYQVNLFSEPNYWHNCWSAKWENRFLIIQIDASYHNHDDVIKCTTREYLTTSWSPPFNYVKMSYRRIRVYIVRCFQIYGSPE